LSELIDTIASQLCDHPFFSINFRHSLLARSWPFQMDFSSLMDFSFDYRMESFFDSKEWHNSRFVMIIVHCIELECNSRSWEKI